MNNINKKHLVTGTGAFSSILAFYPVCFIGTQTSPLDTSANTANRGLRYIGRPGETGPTVSHLCPSAPSATASLRRLQVVRQVNISVLSAKHFAFFAVKPQDISAHSAPSAGNFALFAVKTQGILAPFAVKKRSAFIGRPGETGLPASFTPRSCSFTGSGKGLRA